VVTLLSAGLQPEESVNTGISYITRQVNTSLSAGLQPEKKREHRHFLHYPLSEQSPSAGLQPEESVNTGISYITRQVTAQTPMLASIP
jgi:hypothetical protein